MQNSYATVTQGESSCRSVERLNLNAIRDDCPAGTVVVLLARLRYTGNHSCQGILMRPGPWILFFHVPGAECADH